MFLYASSIPTKSAVGRSGSGCTGFAVNAERSMYASNDAVTGIPRTSSTSDSV